VCLAHRPVASRPVRQSVAAQRRRLLLWESNTLGTWACADAGLSQPRGRCSARALSRRSQRVSGHAMSKRGIAHELVLGRGQLVVHGAVARQAVCDRYEDPLQDRGCRRPSARLARRASSPLSSLALALIAGPRRLSGGACTGRPPPAGRGPGAWSFTPCARSERTRGRRRRRCSRAC
jgi:hypothetical protein